MAAGSAPAGQAVALVERRAQSSTTSPALTSLMLTQAGASVKAVALAGEALHVLEVDRPHALVSDIDLSDEDGYALIRQIRRYEPNTEVFFLRSP